MKKRIRMTEGQVRRVIKTSVYRILNESVCPSKNKLFELLDSGAIDPSELADRLIRWISEDDAKRFLEIYEYDNDDENDEEEDDDRIYESLGECGMCEDDLEELPAPPEEMDITLPRRNRKKDRGFGRRERFALHFPEGEESDLF